MKRFFLLLLLIAFLTGTIGFGGFLFGVSMITLLSFLAPIIFIFIIFAIIKKFINNQNK